MSTGSGLAVGRARFQGSVAKVNFESARVSFERLIRTVSNRLRLVAWGWRRLLVAWWEGSDGDGCEQRNDDSGELHVD